MADFEGMLKAKLEAKPRHVETDESQYGWLTMLLDAYYALQVGTGILLDEEQRKRGFNIACSVGCTSCCLRPEVPVTQLELLGIWWYVMNKMDPGVRFRLNQRLMQHRKSIECPFLIESECSIYPVRPLACRFLHVFGPSCRPEEIPVNDRPSDVWLPRQAVPAAIMYMLPYFGFATEQSQRQALDEGYIISVSMPMRDFPWETLASARKKV
jgi:hypothetical protein